jgi:hypothetical protein
LDGAVFREGKGRALENLSFARWSHPLAANDQEADLDAPVSAQCRHRAVGRTHDQRSACASMVSSICQRNGCFVLGNPSASACFREQILSGSQVAGVALLLGEALVDCRSMGFTQRQRSGEARCTRMSAQEKGAYLWRKALRRVPCGSPDRTGRLGGAAGGGVADGPRL